MSMQGIVCASLLAIPTERWSWANMIGDHVKFLITTVCTCIYVCVCEVTLKHPLYSYRNNYFMLAESSPLVNVPA